jgi:hypothetical protein
MCKKYHFFRYTVEPYSNDRGCHRLLLTRDSPMCPSSENVSIFNSIDSQFISKPKICPTDFLAVAHIGVLAATKL